MAKKSKRMSIVINGEEFDTMREFFDYVIPMLSDGSFKAGHNLDAFNDLLRGGFGVHEYGQPLDITWRNFERSRSMLGDSSVLTLVQIILDSDGGHECTLKLED